MCGQLDKIIPIISPKIEWKIHFNEWSIYHWICVTTEDVTSFIVMSKNPYSKDIFNFSNYIFVSPFKTITWLHLVSSKVYNRSTSQVMLSSHSKIVDTGREREREIKYIFCCGSTHLIESSWYEKQDWCQTCFTWQTILNRSTIKCA